MPNIIMADKPSSGLVLLSSGKYTKTEDGNSMTIPVNYTGTPIFVYVDIENYNNVSQTVRWTFARNLPTGNVIHEDGPACCRLANNTGALVAVRYWLSCNITDTEITVQQYSAGYPIKANDYSWEIWGFAT